jgi:hypothetical protein
VKKKNADVLMRSCGPNNGKRKRKTKDKSKLIDFFFEIKPVTAIFKLGITDTYSFVFAISEEHTGSQLISQISKNKTSNINSTSSVPCRFFKLII